MVGRQKEYDMATSLLTSLDQWPFVLYVKGSIGTGKSLFVEEILRDFRSKCSIIENRPFEYSVEPYSYFTQVICQLNQIYPELIREVKCFDQVLQLLQGESEDTKVSEPTIKNVIRESVSFSSQKKPLILVFEDFHLADATSLELIPSLLENSKEIQFCIILTYKSESIVHPQNFKKARAIVRGAKICQEVELHPFTPDETRLFIEEQPGTRVDKNQQRLLFEKTQGNPFFIKELLTTLRHRDGFPMPGRKSSPSPSDQIPIPDTIKDIVALQMENLSEESRELLEMASVVGNEFEFEMISRLTTTPEAIDELLEKELIFEVKPGIGAFRHKLVQEAVNHGILWSKRRQISRQLAQVLHETNKNPELEGSFWSTAGERENARKAYVKAARKYCMLHAHWDAAHIANKALELWKENEEEDERVEILLELARCTQVTGQLSESIKALREALESSSLENNFAKKAEILRSLAATQALQGTWNKYLEYREKAAENYELSQKFAEATVDFLDLSNRKIDTLEIDESLAYAEKAIKNAKKAGDEKLHSKALSIKGYALSIKGKTGEAVEVANRAIKIAESLHDNEASAYAYRKLAGVFEFSSEFKESIKLYESALSFCNREDLDVQAVFCISCMSWVLFRLGDWKRASEMSMEVINDPTTNDASRATAHAVLALIKAYRGEIKSAVNSIKTGVQLAKKANFKLILFFQHWAGGITEENDENFKDAYFEYKKLIDDWYNIRDMHDCLGGIFSAASYFYEHGHKNDVNECLKIMNLIVQATGNIEAIACLSYINGLTGMMSQNYSQAKDHLESAQNRFNHIGVPIQVINTEYFLALVHVNLDDKGVALKLLKKVVQDAKNLGMRPFAQKISHYLAHEFGEVGGERRKEDNEIRVEQGGLTHRQMEILEGLSEGMSNKEIAAKLFLSTRTVDMHVRNLFVHLNCRSRTEAVKIAKEKGILG